LWVVGVGGGGGGLGGQGGEEKNLRTLVPGQEELEALQCMEEKVPPSKKKRKKSTLHTSSVQNR
jgi:hypothetical protein